MKKTQMFTALIKIICSISLILAIFSCNKKSNKNISIQDPQYEIDNSPSISKICIGPIFSGYTIGNRSLIYSSNGKYLLSNNGNRAILWDVFTGKELRNFKTHLGYITQIAFDPKSKFALINSNPKSKFALINSNPKIYDYWFKDNTQKKQLLKVWDISTGKELNTFVNCNNESSYRKISENGQYVVTSNSENIIKFWDIYTGKVIGTIDNLSSKILKIEFSPDSRIVLIYMKNKIAKLFELDSTRMIASFDWKSKKINDIIISPNNSLIATTNFTGSVELWKISNGELHKTINSELSGYFEISFSPDNSKLLTRKWRDSYSIWNVHTGEKIAIINTDYMNSSIFTPDSKYLIITGRASEPTNLWDVNTGKVVRTFCNTSGIINEHSFSPNGDFFAMNDGIWNISTGEKVQSLSEFNSEEKTPKVDEEHLIIFNEQHRDLLNLIDGNTISICDSLNLHNSLTADLNNELVIVSTQNKALSVRIQNIKTGKYISNLELNGLKINKCSISNNGMYIATQTFNSVTLWNSKTGEKISKLEGHKSWNIFSEKNFGTIYSSNDTLHNEHNRIAQNKYPNAEKIGHINSITSIQFSHDDNFIITGSEDYSVKLWSVKTGKLIKTFLGHNSWINDISFSPDGKFIITSANDESKDNLQATSSLNAKNFSDHLYLRKKDGSFETKKDMNYTMKLWDIASGEVISDFEKYSESVNSVSFSPNGKYVVSGSDYNTVILWEASTGKEIKRFCNLSSSVKSVFFSSDGNRIIAKCHFDGKIYIWDTESGDELARIIYWGPNDWAIITPDNLFEYSNNNSDYLHFVRDNVVFELYQFAESFYHPKLLQDILKGKTIKKPLISLEQKLLESPPPIIEIVSKEKSFSFFKKVMNLKVRVTRNGSVLNKIRLVQNGESIINTSKKLCNLKNNESIIISFKTKLSKGKNEFSISAFNVCNIESRRYEFEIDY